MAAREQRDQHLFDDLVLTDDDLAQFLADGGPGFGEFAGHFFLQIRGRGHRGVRFVDGFVRSHGNRVIVAHKKGRDSEWADLNGNRAAGERKKLAGWRGVAGTLPVLKAMPRTQPAMRRRSAARVLPVSRVSRLRTGRRWLKSKNATPRAGWEALVSPTQTPESWPIPTGLENRSRKPVAKLDGAFTVAALCHELPENVKHEKGSPRDSR